jgi:cytochrome c oxidase assembly protein subunit 15
MKWLGVSALGAVILQGALGGLTVLFFLPTAISSAHAGLAEIFFCMTVAIALFTSRSWLVASASVNDPILQRIASATTLTIYAQILVGAVMRHSDAGLAIPDFPWMFGHVIPNHWDPKIAIHFAHRVGALFVTLAVLATSAHISTLILFLVAAQVTLGALTVLSQRDVWINSVHLVNGALVLATSIVITLRSWQAQIAQKVRLPPSREALRRTAVALAEAGQPDPDSRLRPDPDIRLRPDHGVRP